MDETEANLMMKLAIGRLFRLASQPEWNEDIKRQYHMCERMVRICANALGMDTSDAPVNEHRKTFKN